MPLLKTLLFTIFVPCTVTILIPRQLLSGHSVGAAQNGSALNFLGLISIAIGAAIYFWCAWDFATVGRGTPAPIDPPKELVVRGPYRFTRNPMYVGVLLILSGETALFASPLLLIYSITVLLLFQLFIRFYEEPTLTRQFGESYRHYCSAVPRWLPRFNNWAGKPAR